MRSLLRFRGMAGGVPSAPCVGILGFKGRLRLLLPLLFAVALQAQPAWEVIAKVQLPGPTLQVELRMAAGDDDAYRINAGCGAFVEGLEREVDGVWKAVPWSGDEGLLPGAEARGAHLRYRFRLGEAAASLRRLMLVTGGEEAYLVRPSAFLLRPNGFWPRRRARLRVEAPPGWTWLTGLPEGDTTTEAMDDAPYSALGRLERRQIHMAGADLPVAWPAAQPWDWSVLEPWVRRSAEEVGWAFGGFPVPRTALFLWPSSRGRGVGFGTAAGLGGTGVIVLLGKAWTAEHLLSDWVLTHELTHLGLPSLDPSHRWLEEGLPTYLEPLLALRAGRITPERFWGDLVKDLPQGQPKPGDRGLDRTPTWGRTYWGGALFFFLADLELRERSGGRSGLVQALKGLRPAGLDARVASDLEPLLAALDRGSGQMTFTALHRRHGTEAERVDLEALWRRLGVQVADGKVVFDEGAPLAALRRSWAAPLR